MHIQLGNLAATLDEIAAHGIASFYHGDLAHELLADLQDAGSVITAGDLAAMQAREAHPLIFNYRNAQIATLDGLFAGPSLAMAMAHVEQTEVAGDWPDEQEFLAYAAGLKRAYSHRLAHMGDSSDAAAPSAPRICAWSMLKATWYRSRRPCSRFSAPRVMLPRTGILMNNGIMWFDPRPGQPNSMGPGKRPLSNMCPVIAQNDAMRIALAHRAAGALCLP